MNYLHGQILSFSLRALYRFGMSFSESDEVEKKKHLEVMKRHIEFISECTESLPVEQ